MEKHNQKNKNNGKEEILKKPEHNGEELIRQAEESNGKQGLSREEDERMEISISEFVELNKKAKLCSEYHDKLMRLTAEFDNARKRMLKEKEDLIKFASQDLMAEILPIVDDFDRLIEGIKNDQASKAVLDGIKMIQGRIHELLEDNGLVRMKVVGEKFDPTKHEALATLETDEYPDHAIMEEVRSGYYLNGRVLRPAVVKVATAKTAKEPQNPQNDMDNLTNK